MPNFEELKKLFPGMDFVALPSIEDRLKMPRHNSMALPTDVHKVRVFKYDNEDWRLEVKGILQSQFGGSFETQQDAINYINTVIKG